MASPSVSLYPSLTISPGDSSSSGGGGSSASVSSPSIPAISSISQDQQHSDQFSGVIVSQNAQATGSINWRSSPYRSQTIYQTFYLPSDIQAGTAAYELNLPDLSGLQVMVTIDQGYSKTASLGYTLDYYALGSGWTNLANGVAIGCHTDGQAWFDIIFNQPVTVTPLIASSKMRIGIATQSTVGDVVQESVTNLNNGTYVVETQLITANLQNEIPYPVTVNGRAGFLFNDNGSVSFSAQQGVSSLWYVQPGLAVGSATLSDGLTPLLGGSTLNFRVLGLVADNGTDFLGNEYRSRVTRMQGDSGDAWMSPALPSPFAVANRYWDVRPTDFASVPDLNLCTNPSFEYDALGATTVYAWAPYDQSVTRTNFEILNTWFAKGSQSLRSTSTFSSNSGAYSGVVHPGTGTSGILIKSGSELNIQCVINLLSLPPTGSLVVSLLWYDNTGAPLSSTPAASLSTTGVQTVYIAHASVPPTARFVALAAFCSAATTGTLDFFIDSVLTSPTTLTYFDGDLPNYIWMGQRGHSYSSSVPSTQSSNAVVIDGIFVDPSTPNMNFNVYYSVDDSTTSVNMSTADWEQKLWTRVPKTFVATQAQHYVFPEPVTAKYMKLEFTNLPAQTFTPGRFAKPVRYKKFPTWVADYFIAQLEQIAFVSNLVNVQNDALTLAYDYYLDDLQQKPDAPVSNPTQVLSTLTDYFNINNVANQVDIGTLQSINLIMSRFQLPTGSIVDNSSLLGAKALTLASNVQTTATLTTEAGPPPSTSTSIVSTTQREPVILEQSMDSMYFFLTCRHTYKELMASFDYNKAYFAGTNSVSFLRFNYSAAVDSDLYIEAGGDLRNAEVNDFKIDTDSNWYAYVG